jgi:hypothetical protein
MDNDNEHDNNNSPILKLESLNIKYNNLLIEYRQAVLNYSVFLKENNEKDMISFQGTKYFGLSSIAENKLSNIKECETTCANTPSCTGATYNIDTQICKLSSGNGNITTGLPNEFAIVSKGNHLLSIVEKINNELMNVNNEIQQNNNDLKPIQTQQSGVELIDRFNILSKEREKINKLLNETNTLDQSINQSTLITNRNYFSFILLLGVAVIIICVFIWGIRTNTIGQSGGSKLDINAYYIILVIAFIILLLLLVKK